MFKLAEASAVKSRSQAINQLKAVLVSSDPQLDDELSGLSRTMLVRHCTGLRRVTATGYASVPAYPQRLLPPPVWTPDPGPA